MNLIKLSLNLESMRKKLLMHIKLPDTFRQRLNYTDSFYPFTFYVKNIFHKMKGILGEVFANFSHNKMDFPFRGLYFVSSKNDYAPKSNIEEASELGTIGNNALDSTDLHEESSLFLTDLIDKIICREVNTVIPISHEFYKKRILKRLVLFFSIIIFGVLSYYSYISYIDFKPQIEKVYDQWKITNN